MKIIKRGPPISVLKSIAAEAPPRSIKPKPKVKIKFEKGMPLAANLAECSENLGIAVRHRYMKRKAMRRWPITSMGLWST